MMHVVFAYIQMRKRAVIWRVTLFMFKVSIRFKYSTHCTQNHSPQKIILKCVIISDSKINRK